jgi:starch synthase
MKVLYIAAECKPFSKTGGVGDVAGELPPELKRQGIDIEIATPLYGIIKPEYIGHSNQEYSVQFGGKKEAIQVFNGDLNGVPVHFVKNANYFEGRYQTPYINSEGIPFYDDILRFSFFSEACLDLIKTVNPDIVHINDWPLCFLFGRMVMEHFPQKRVLTYHNIGYQGNIGRYSIGRLDIQKLDANEEIGPLFEDPRKEWNSVNPLRMGLELSHMANTVSPTYLKESLEPENQNRFFEGGKGLDGVARRLNEEGRLLGILNGFEYDQQPTDENFAQTLSLKNEMKKKISGLFQNHNDFLVGFVGRAVEQKFKLLTETLGDRSIMEHLLGIPDMNIAVVATGLPEYETFLRNVRHQGNLLCTIAFDKAMAKQISLGSDIFLMPSLYEPCGITQLESMSNATPPLVRWTGGLVDTVADFRGADGTGFGFDGPNRYKVLEQLIETVRTAQQYYQSDKEGFQQLQKRGFKKRFLWSDSAKQYIDRVYLPTMKSK